MTPAILAPVRDEPSEHASDPGPIGSLSQAGEAARPVADSENEMASNRDDMGGSLIIRLRAVRGRHPGPAPHKNAPRRTRRTPGFAGRQGLGSLGAGSRVRSARGLGFVRRGVSGSFGARTPSGGRGEVRMPRAWSPQPTPRGTRDFAPGHLHISTPWRTEPGRLGSLGAEGRVRSAHRAAPRTPRSRAISAAQSP
jgi:hypothetical protein